MNNDIKL